MYLSNISLIFLQTKMFLVCKNVPCLPACPCTCGLIYFSRLLSKSVGNKVQKLKKFEQKNGSKSKSNS